MPVTGRDYPENVLMTDRVQGRQLKDQIPFGVGYGAGCQDNDSLYIHLRLRSKYQHAGERNGLEFCRLPQHLPFAG